jgi:hypothetical protein
MEWTQWKVNYSTVRYHIPCNSDLYQHCERHWDPFSLTSHAFCLSVLHLFVHYTACSS